MPTPNPADARPEPLTRSSALLALATSVFWGGNIVALKLALATVPPFWCAFWRFALGSAAIALWARFRGAALRPRRLELRPLGVLTVLFTLQIILLNTGVDLTSPAYAIILLNAHPIFSNLAGHFVSSEQRLSGVRLAGLTLAFGGICYLALGHPIEALAPHPITGNLMLVVSAFLLGIRTVYTRRLVQSIDPLRAMFCQGLASLPVFLVSALILEPFLLKPLTWPPIAALLYQGLVIAGACFIIWTLLLRRHSAGTLAMYSFTVPFFGIAFSALLFGEPVTDRILTGAALVTAGILLVTGKHPDDTEHPSPEPRDETR